MKLFLLFLIREFLQINHIFEILLRATSVLGVSKETDLNFELIFFFRHYKMSPRFLFRKSSNSFGQRTKKADLNFELILCLDITKMF